MENPKEYDVNHLRAFVENATIAGNLPDAALEALDKLIATAAAHQREAAQTFAMAVVDAASLYALSETWTGNDNDPDYPADTLIDEARDIIEKVPALVSENLELAADVLALAEAIKKLGVACGQGNGLAAGSSADLAALSALADAALGRDRSGFVLAQQASEMKACLEDVLDADGDPDVMDFQRYRNVLDEIDQVAPQKPGAPHV